MIQGQVYFLALMFLHSLVCTFFQHGRLISTNKLKKLNNIKINSAEGVQLGDPLGPLLFCFTIHPLISSHTSDLVIGYLDDLTLGGKMDTVVADVESIRVGGLHMGLRLNDKKSEYITESHLSVLPSFSNFGQVTPDDATIRVSCVASGE